MKPSERDRIHLWSGDCLLIYGDRSMRGVLMLGDHHISFTTEGKGFLGLGTTERNVVWSLGTESIARVDVRTTERGSELMIDHGDKRATFLFQGKDGKEQASSLLYALDLSGRGREETSFSMKRIMREYHEEKGGN